MNSPLRPCTFPGCRALVQGSSRCEAHSRRDSYPAGSTTARGYDGDWRRLRDLKMRTDPVCELRIHCQGAVAEDVHHVISIRQRPDLRLTLSNLRSACHACHKAAEGMVVADVPNDERTQYQF